MPPKTITFVNHRTTPEDSPSLFAVTGGNPAQLPKQISELDGYRSLVPTAEEEGCGASVALPDMTTAVQSDIAARNAIGKIDFTRSQSVRGWQD
jgi:hypothetical protein